MAYQNKHPYVFIHGMMGWGENETMYKAPYWGMVCGNLVKQLRDEGIEAYAPKVAPAGSAWDRACELYAHLTGTTVDYGIAHSREKGHNRFGRTYAAPLFEGWGKPMPDGTIKKVHLLGHSFGGATMRMFAELLENGSAAERAVTPANQLSPLFEGGHGELVKSITALAAPHDGTTFVHAFPKIMVGVTYGVLGLASVVGNTGANKFYDFYMEHFGLTGIPGDVVNKRNILNIKQIRHIVKSRDNVFADLRIDQAMDLNREIHCSKNTYYFSFSTRGTQPVGNGNEEHAPIMIFAFWPFAKVMGRFPETEIGGAHIDASWHANDGLVPTESGRYPHLEPHVFYKDLNGKKPQKGIWHVMEDKVSDHGTIIGGSLTFIGPKKSAPFKKFYHEHIAFLESLED